MCVAVLFEADLMKCDVQSRSKLGGGLRCFVGQVSPVAGIVVCQSIQLPGYMVMSLAPAIIVIYLYPLPTVWQPALRWLDCMPPMAEGGLCSGHGAIMRLLKSELTMHSSLIWLRFGTPPQPQKADWHYFLRLLLLDFCTHTQRCCLPTLFCGCWYGLGNLIILGRLEEMMVRLTSYLIKVANKSLWANLHSS